MTPIDQYDHGSFTSYQPHPEDFSLRSRSMKVPGLLNRPEIGRCQICVFGMMLGLDAKPLQPQDPGIPLGPGSVSERVMCVGIRVECGNWAEIEERWVAPFYGQTAYLEPMVLGEGMLLGEWTWSYVFSDIVHSEGTFTVEGPLEDVMTELG